MKTGTQVRLMPAVADQGTRMALVATWYKGRDETTVGVARYDALGPRRPVVAEFAIVVEHSYQGQGWGVSWR